MNNGVNNTNQVDNSVNDQPVLIPMAGVKLAPAQDMPVNASKGDSTAVAASNVTTEAQTVNTTVSNTQQVAEQVQPQQVVQPQVLPQQAPTVAQPVIQNSVPVSTPDNSNQVVKEKKKINLVPILGLIIIGLLFFLFYSNKLHNEQLANMKYNCTPITSSKEEIKLDLNSTLVKDLYSKVETNIREDIANPNFDNSMKLYLAYRQIKDKDKYDSNCNLFSTTATEPYICEVSTKFTPKAFKAETLIQEIKKLYGEETELELDDIQLGNSCIVGYQYIKDRGDNGEYVEGYCKQAVATSFKVTKTLKEATSTRNTIILKEEVKYHENEKLNLPDTLKSGIYYYTFRLDMNYNYVLVSKTYETKY